MYGVKIKMVNTNIYSKTTKNMNAETCLAF